MRLTTDSPKNNVEMALNLFFVKDKEVWVRGYGKDGADISLFDLSRDLTRWNCPYVDLDISDDSFSMMMAEWLWEDVESFEHVLALLYQAAWVCAELREHLKQFEDSKLSPEDAVNLHAILRLGDGMTLMRLRELAVADQEGRVVVLPCKVGDRVYIPDIESKTVANVRVQGISITPKSRVVLHFGGYPVESAWGDRCGIDWFITFEEAEKALREMEGKKDD